MTYTFGPQRDADGRWRFRLWAPSAESVELLLTDADGARDTRAMAPDDDAGPGWLTSGPLQVEPGQYYGFRINGDLTVPDPASRRQDGDVHDLSVLCEALPAIGDWTPPAWENTVISELHIGACGGLRGLHDRLPALAATGITVIELMPVADFPGTRNWGYDGVLPYAPDGSYGSASELQQLIADAHGQGIAVWLDVVYNHFGPEGNYLHLYAKDFFAEDLSTPWGAGIDMRVPEVRAFFIENALYWLGEVGFDGLRLDAVHAIHDPSERHVLDELVATVRERLPDGDRKRLVLENDRNEARFLRRPESYQAQWNDDMHHALHVNLTGESFGYYSDFAAEPDGVLLRALAGGFARRGWPSTDLSPTSFIACLQNHDQIGNRAWGERLTELAEPTALRTATALLLLAPQIPMLFMGEEWFSRTPFRFFSSFGGDLADAVRAGRRREFDLDDIPDPEAAETFLGSSLEAPGDSSFHTGLLALRRRWLQPILSDLAAGQATGGGDEAISVRYPWSQGWWCIDVNLNAHPRPRPADPRGEPRPHGGTGTAPAQTQEIICMPEAFGRDAVMPAWSLRVTREEQV